MILQMRKNRFLFKAYEVSQAHQCAVFAKGNSCKLPNRNFIGMTYLEDNSWLYYKFPLFIFEQWKWFSKNVLSFAPVKIDISNSSRPNINLIINFFWFYMTLNFAKIPLRLDKQKHIIFLNVSLLFLFKRLEYTMKKF